MRIISKRNGFKLDSLKRKKQQRFVGRVHNAGEYGLPLVNEDPGIVIAGPTNETF